jgi:hypothetical protein
MYEVVIVNIGRCVKYLDFIIFSYEHIMNRTCMCTYNLHNVHEIYIYIYTLNVSVSILYILINRYLSQSVKTSLETRIRISLFRMTIMLLIPHMKTSCHCPGVHTVRRNRWHGGYGRPDGQ